jgi:hypothetical protein
MTSLARLLFGNPKLAIVIVDDIVGGLLQADSLCIKKPICRACPGSRTLYLIRIHAIEPP